MIRKVFLIAVCAFALSACAHKSSGPGAESCACGKKSVKAACACEGCNNGGACSCGHGSGSCGG